MRILKLFSIFQLFSLIFVVGFLLGVLNIHFSDKSNYCLMTYMYEYPQFVRLSLPENKQYPQYGLYAYSEGRLTEKARKMWFDGIPVLFLPGNCGSHMQARSIASVALRKALSKGYDYHFDFFTVGYNEELSGLYGGVLQSQTKFAAASVSKILGLYKSNKYTKGVPTSVILIGHSMGGLIAKRLLAYPSTINTTNIAIALAAPLEAPVMNFDLRLNDFYMLMNYEWEVNINNNEEYKNKKMLISIANGPRDILMPSGLTLSNDSYINSLTTSIPGVWVSPDHVCIVWCKQLVLVINKFLFSLIDTVTEQITEDQLLIKEKAKQFFVANRSIAISPGISRGNFSMVADGFWYEDNRRIYQISRPEIDKTTYLMVRLVQFPQNRFLAVEAVNVDDKEWIFGCNAKHTYHMHRYCKFATSLNELSRWTGAANGFGLRKIATVNLHKLKEAQPDWTHVIVKVSPTRKPITLNVDINDHASREIHINAPSLFSLGRTIVIHETERDSLYYEIVLKNFNAIHQAYLLNVEPTVGCKATQYHVSAEVHVPWAENNEYYHFFTQAKRSPMKLRLYKTNPNITQGLDTTEYVKVTLLLDPQCTYTVSISTSWYHTLAQLVRNYTPILVPYVAAIALLAVRNNMVNLKEKGVCISVHSALASDATKPYYSLVFARLVTMAFTSIPILTTIFENASWRNGELEYLTKSLYIVPAYMTALGLLNIVLVVTIAIMVFSSQITHRLLFRIMWRGGSSGLAEKVASGLQKVPMVVSSALVCAAPFSCGAASLAAGSAFYAFMLSKMYEEYLEDYFYKIISKIASKFCRLFKPKPKRQRQNQPEKNAAGQDIKWHNLEELEQECFIKKERPESHDDDLSNLNFHMTMFLMWIVVTVVNIPALLTWARNFKYSTTLKPDTSYHTGLALSVCSTFIWQMDGPKKNLRHYDLVSSLLFTMAVFILALGPFSLAIVNYGVTFMFIVITGQQVLDKEIQLEKNDQCLVIDNKECPSSEGSKDKAEEDSRSENKSSQCEENKSTKNASPQSEENKTRNVTSPCEENKQEPSASTSDNVTDDCDVCNENRIYSLFKNLRDKFNINTDDL